MVVFNNEHFRVETVFTDLVKTATSSGYHLRVSREQTLSLKMTTQKFVHTFQLHNILDMNFPVAY